MNNYETKQGKTIWELGPDSAKIYQKDPNYKSNRDPLTAGPFPKRKYWPTRR